MNLFRFLARITFAIFTLGVSEKNHWFTSHSDARQGSTSMGSQWIDKE